MRPLFASRLSLTPFADAAQRFIKMKHTVWRRSDSRTAAEKVNNFVVFMFLFCYALVWHVILLLIKQSLLSSVSQSVSLHTNEHNLDSFWDVPVHTS